MDGIPPVRSWAQRPDGRPRQTQRRVGIIKKGERFGREIETRSERREHSHADDPGDAPALNGIDHKAYVKDESFADMGGDVVVVVPPLENGALEGNLCVVEAIPLLRQILRLQAELGGGPGSRESAGVVPVSTMNGSGGCPLMLTWMTGSGTVSGS